MAGKFENKVVLVTGASSGIGRASALKFAQEGARVMVADINVEGSEETVHLIKEIGGESTFIRTDVSNAIEVEAMVNQTIETYGQLDCALNNAGIEGTPFVSTIDYSESDWDRVININLKGVWLCLKYEIPQMLKQGGAIVNLSSVAGLIGSRFGVAYHASKHGVIGVTKAAAIEYARKNIRVNALCPGVIRTRMGAVATKNDPEIEKKAAAGHPLGRLGTPEEVAEAAVWLCSDASSFVTGHAMPVDGGLVAQ